MTPSAPLSFQEKLARFQRRQRAAATSATDSAPRERDDGARTPAASGAMPACADRGSVGQFSSEVGGGGGSGARKSSRPVAHSSRPRAAASSSSSLSFRERLARFQSRQRSAAVRAAEDAPRRSGDGEARTSASAAAAAVDFGGRAPKASSSVSRRQSRPQQQQRREQPPLQPHAEAKRASAFQQRMQRFQARQSTPAPCTAPSVAGEHRCEKRPRSPRDDDDENGSKIRFADLEREERLSRRIGAREDREELEHHMRQTKRRLQ